MLSSRIAEWVSKQAEREREKEQKKQERLARRRSMPKHMFDDKTYTQNIQQNSERIEAALHQGEVIAWNFQEPSRKCCFKMYLYLKSQTFFFYYLFLFILDPTQLCPSSHFVPSLFLLPVELPFHFKLNVFWFFFLSLMSFTIFLEFYVYIHT